MRKILNISVLAVILVLFSMLLCSCLNSDKIPDRKTAIEYGSGILEDKFPDYYEKIEKFITADESKDTWRVYNNYNLYREPTDRSTPIIYGGVFYVEFRKDNGEIIDMGFSD